MSNTSISFFISFLAGISTMLGTIFIFIKVKKINKFISAALSLSSGIMLSICILDLIPEGFNIFNTLAINNIRILFIALLYILIGLLIGYILDNNIEGENKLTKVGIFSMITLVIHNIPEGIITFITSYNNIKLGIMLSLSIAMHNIPEGIIISIPIYYGTKSKKKAFLYTFISGISELLGAILTYVFLKKYITLYILGIIYFITSGIMLYVSIFNLIRESFVYDKKVPYLFFTLGIVLSIIKSLIFVD